MLSKAEYSIACNYQDITILQVRYYAVTHYYIGLTFQKLSKDMIAVNASKGVCTRRMVKF